MSRLAPSFTQVYSKVCALVEFSILKLMPNSGTYYLSAAAGKWREIQWAYLVRDTPGLEISWKNSTATLENMPM